jgi:hypothetical protein
MIKLLVALTSTDDTDDCVWFTDKEGSDFVWKPAAMGGSCTNCNRDVTDDGEVLMGIETKDGIWCTGCIIIQTVPQIITAYEQCSEKLEKLIEVLKDAGVADQVSDIIGEV